MNKAVNLSSCQHSAFWGITMCRRTVDTLSHLSKLSVKLSLTPGVLDHLITQHGTPQVYIFAFHLAHVLLQYVTRLVLTSSWSPDAFMVNWAQWMYVYLFPHPAYQVIYWVCEKVTYYPGKVLLITPRWMVQLWCTQLLQWFPSSGPTFTVVGTA